MTPFIAEIIGTAILILLGNGVVANVLLDDTKGHDSGLIVISMAWGLAVYCGVIVAGPISGAHLNPAVTIGLAVAGGFDWADVPHYIIAQCMGAALGSILVWLSYKDHYSKTKNHDAKLATFCTDPAIKNYPYNFLTELIATFVLVFVILYIAEPEITATGLTDGKIGLGSVGAIPVAFLVMAIGMSLGGPTGYAINPVRDFLPRVMHGILPVGDKRDGNWGYAWVPILGPFVGAILAGLLFIFLA